MWASQYLYEMSHQQPGCSPLCPSLAKSFLLWRWVYFRCMKTAQDKSPPAALQPCPAEKNKSHRASGRQRAPLSYSHRKPVLWLSTCSKPTWIHQGFSYWEVYLLPSLTPRCFPLQVKHLKDLEKEKDVLFCGLEILEKTELWYLQRLEGNRSRRNFILETKRDLGCSQVATLEVRFWYFSELQQLWHPYELLFWGCYYTNTSLNVREMIKD